MQAPRRYARPVVTRSKVVLEMAAELAVNNDWAFQQASVTLRPQGGDETGVCLFGCDSHEAIESVARGEVHLAIINPAEPLTLAVRGTGPFKEPIPLRAIAVIPSLDSYAFTVSERTGLNSLEDIRDQKYPLRVSLRGQRDHSNHFLEKVVFETLGFSLDDIVKWGGEVRYDHGLPNGISTSGANYDVTRIDLAKRGDIDAIFDEAVNAWLGLALDTGFRAIPLKEPVVEKLESMGFRRSLLKKERWPKLPGDVLSLDFSGWPIYTHANVSDEVVTSFCAALEARKDQIPWQGDGPLPLESMCKDSPEGPLDIPLHPAAERFWAKCGYLK